jgi:hypothetical protein
MRKKTSINLEDAGETPDEIDNDPLDEDTSRRDFLKVAGATTTAGAMGTLAGLPATVVAATVVVETVVAETAVAVEVDWSRI